MSPARCGVHFVQEDGAPLPMECRISPENAKLLDQTLGQNATKTMYLSTTGNITLQTRLENSTLHTNITLLKSFFLELLVKKSVTVEFQCTRFHRHEMEFLEIKLEDYFVEFYWKFKQHTFTKVLCISHVVLKSIDFEYRESFELESSLVQEVVRLLACSEIMFCFGDVTAFRNALAPESTFLAIPNSSRIRDAAFSVLRKSLKAATEGPFEKYDFLIDREERRLNICAECDGITVSHMATVYVE